VNRAAVKIARALPSLEGVSDADVAELVAGHAVLRGVAATRRAALSHGETIAVRWARITEELLIECDAETVDALLEVVDRLRAGMAR